MSQTKLQLELDQLYEEKAKGAFIRSRRRWMGEGEKNTRYFFNLEKRNAELSSIHKLDINGQTSVNMKEISYCVKHFYEELYAEELHNTNETFFSSIKNVVKCIDEDSKKACDEKITVAEIKICISKVKNNKSPGNDGLTSEFYKEFKDDIADFLLCVFEEALEAGKLPPTMSQGLITLIPNQIKICYWLKIGDL